MINPNAAFHEAQIQTQVTGSFFYLHI